ncbi:sulfite exporter TauE/SafE family protein [Phycicoccus flavus]|uniref:sulfite exporter TauE/SafE family protein n=1 Tax=Phycicoccus flavus TaxID=2502783 RepID=UPI000FEB5EEA|nr:sulfite exporter TauE/SafE family protein [Phycicoccus flavus]NHA69039.1 sulfite exporter TauE/SafE family protein [Phycicoccus flavus]
MSTSWRESRTAPPALPSFRRAAVTNLVLALAVWTAWLTLGGGEALDALAEHWGVALTMVAGSLVGGGTSEGGGAVGFPVLTKVLGVAPEQARLFTFAIQSVGMTGASLSLLAQRVPLEWRTLRWGAPSAMVGVTVSVLVLAPLVPPAIVRIGFTVLLAGMGLALLVHRLRGSEERNDRIPVWGRTERWVVVAAGVVGGALSGAAGVGENTVMFVVLVLLMRVCEKVATPTTVVLLTVTSVTAFLLHLLVVGDFRGPVVGQWLAATPVVIAGAPLGAWLCTRMSRGTIRGVLWALIAAELVSTWFIVPMTPVTRVVFVGLLGATTVGCLWLTGRRRYAPRPARVRPRTLTGAGHRGG